MIALIAKHKAMLEARPSSLERRWRRTFNRLLAVLLVAGAGGLGGTVYLVASASDTAHDVEAEAGVLAQLREDVVAETIFLSGPVGQPGSAQKLVQLQAAVTAGFAHADAVSLSPRGRDLLGLARSRWSAAVARLRAMPANTPAAVRGLILGQVLGVEAPGVLTQLDAASDAGRTAARAQLSRERGSAAILLAGLVTLTLLGLWMVKRLGRRLTTEVLEPVGRMRASADQLAAGDLSHRVEVSRLDEIGSLGVSFNAMADAIAGSQHRLTLEATQDSLTGLANRAGFRVKAEAALTRPDRRRGEQAVLFIDLDDFKDVNDLYGHGAGDELLRVVGERLAQVIRPTDLVARLGGDEFAIHLDNLPSAQEAFDLAERLVAAVREPAVVLGHPVQVGASIGLAMAHECTDLDGLMQEADQAMYAAKGQGKNRVECYDASLHQALVEHHTLRADIVLAVARDELVLDYQPVVALGRGALTGVEALVRWQHPTRGLLPPSAFVALAEQTGFMPEMGMWVLKTAVAQMDLWQRRYNRPELTLAVNVSALQLTDPGFVPAVAALLGASRMRPETLTLEVTESMLVDENGPIPQALRDLRLLGVRVAIDDFGTGYASIGHLKILPVDVLKIDRSFVVSARESTRGEVLLGGLVQLAMHLGLDVIPEGIELAEDLQRLERMGCEQGQGFLLSRPVPPVDLEEWLADPGDRLPWAISDWPQLPLPRPSAPAEVEELRGTIG